MAPHTRPSLSNDGDYPDNADYWHRECATCGEQYMGPKLAPMCYLCSTYRPIYESDGSEQMIEDFKALFTETPMFSNPGTLGWLLFTFAALFFLVMALSVSFASH